MELAQGELLSLRLWLWALLEEPAVFAGPRMRQMCSRLQSAATRVVVAEREAGQGAAEAVGAAMAAAAPKEEKADMSVAANETDATRRVSIGATQGVATLSFDFLSGRIVSIGSFTGCAAGAPSPPGNDTHARESQSVRKQRDWCASQATRALPVRVHEERGEASLLPISQVRSAAALCIRLRVLLHVNLKRPRSDCDSASFQRALLLQLI